MTNFNSAKATELRLFLEELCCELCWLQHVLDEGVEPEAVNIRLEYYLGAPGAFADIRVAVDGRDPYFVEVKYGYPSDVLLRHLQRKYGPDVEQQAAGKVIVLVDQCDRADWDRLQREISNCLAPVREVEIWTEKDLRGLLDRRFGVHIESFSEEGLLNLRAGMLRALSVQAFGEDGADGAAMHALKASLLWHMGAWQVRRRRQACQLSIRDTLPPGLYSGAVVLLADMCAFSAYVRDTPDGEVVRTCLTSFYSKARHQIISMGGFLYQFVGDEIVALFGISDDRSDYVERALDAALALVDIGNSVSHHWQRHIDRVQEKGGLHLGMAIGDLQIVSVQPYGRAQIGVIGDAINMAARLMSMAGPSQIVVSNTMHQHLPYDRQKTFEELQPIDARNMGRIKAWRLAALDRPLAPSAEPE